MTSTALAGSINVFAPLGTAKPNGTVTICTLDLGTSSRPGFTARRS